MEDELDAVKRLRAGVFGRGARDYDRVGTPIFGRLGRRLVELAAVQAGDHVLDVATGRGAVLFAAAELVGERGRVIGVDLAEEMVTLTSADMRARGITNAEVRVADAERLSEFVDGEFDCVTCAFAMSRRRPPLRVVPRASTRVRSLGQPGNAGVRHPGRARRCPLGVRLHRRAREHRAGSAAPRRSRGMVALAAYGRRSSGGRVPRSPSESPVSGSRLRTDSRRVRGGCAGA
jgi:SAM-dependent methyltransferase